MRETLSMHRFTATGVALAVAWACGAPVTQHANPNLLLVVMDTSRASRMSLYGYDDATTPRIDDFAAGGVVFEQAIAHASQTLPSVASLLTSTLPPEHGARVNGLYRVRDEPKTLAEVLRAHHYQTAAVVSALPLKARYGLDRGFDAYLDDFSDSVLAARGGTYGAIERRADEATDAALAWLRDDARRGQPWFLLVHYFDPHSPYAPPAGFRDRRDSYDGEIAFTDSEIGRLLDAIRQDGQLDDTLVAIVADHGEVLSQNYQGHAGSLAEGVVRVPLVLWHPERLPAGKRIEGNAGLIDLAPTLLEVLGIPAPASYRGRSLLPRVVGADATPDRPVYSESLYHKLEDPRGVSRFLARDGRYRYRLEELENGDTEIRSERLVDVKHTEGPRDVLGEPPLSPAEERALEKLRGVVRRERARSRELVALELSAEDEALLRALGYLGADAGVESVEPN